MANRTARWWPGVLQGRPTLDGRVRTWKYSWAVALEIYDILDGYLIGSSNQRKIHAPDCETVQGVPLRSMVVFKSIKDGKKRGYTPCGFCAGDPMTAVLNGVSVRGPG